MLSGWLGSGSLDWQPARSCVLSHGPAEEGC
jgi:hypothetical protein